jgi:hypothetical protein
MPSEFYWVLVWVIATFFVFAIIRAGDDGVD